MTRLESYLEGIRRAMAGQSAEVPSTPLTREEKYLDGILKKIAGTTGAEIPETPVTRIEAYLNGIYESSTEPDAPSAAGQEF